MWKQVVGLEYDTHLLPELTATICVFSYFLTVDGNAPRARSFQSGKQSQRGGFPSARRADQC